MVAANRYDGGALEPVRNDTAMANARIADAHRLAVHVCGLRDRVRIVVSLLTRTL